VLVAPLAVVLQAFGYDALKLGRHSAQPDSSRGNDGGEVVGFAIDASGQRALVWQNNVPVDLNTLIPAGSPWYLQAACSINNAGEIAGQGLINGEVHAFLLTPHSGADSNIVAPVTQSVATPKAAPEDVRKMLGRIGGRPIAQR
jgi:probable HAF family extracellular repeat protein